MGSWFLPVGDDIDSRIASPRIRALFDYWRSLAVDGVVPARSSVDPAAIKSLLPNLMIVELSPEPLRVRYRLVGTEVVRFTGIDITWHYLDELELDEFSEAELLEVYRKQRDDGWPVQGVAEYAMQGKRMLRTEYIICPLLDAQGQASQAIVLEDYLLAHGIDIRELPTARLRG
jgi:hypothetical protein